MLFKELRQFEKIKPGARVKLVRGLFDMEKDLIKKGNVNFQFVRWAKPQGYAVVKDSSGAKWHIHPEALIKEDKKMNLRKRTYISEGRRPPKGTPRVGTRVVFDPNVVSMAMYPHKEKLPRRGEEGTVTTIPLPGGKSHYMPGPMGGLLYVKWDKAGILGVSPIDVKKVGVTNEEKLYEAIMAITDKGLEPLKSGIRIQKNTEYYMGASSDPKHIIVTDVNDRFITYMTYPYKNKLRIDRKIGEDLIIQGVRTWIKNYGRRYPEDVANFNKLLAGKKGETVDPSDFQRVDVRVKVIGKHASDPEALWREAERYGGVGFNMKNKVFEISTSRGSIPDIKKNKNFKIISIK